MQAAEIINRIGLQRVLAETSNMPVAGGCSLASILWLRDNEPEVFKNAACYGHSNTFLRQVADGQVRHGPVVGPR